MLTLEVTTHELTLSLRKQWCLKPVCTVEVSSGKEFIFMEARMEALFKKAEEYTILEKFPGSQLKDEKYEPILPYFAEYGAQGAFRVLADDYVTQDSGTGVVHMAPYFGADDYRQAICGESSASLL